MAGLEFENLNPYLNLEFLIGDSAEDLKAQLMSLKNPIKILNIYSLGTKHIVWFLTDVKIKKIKRGK